MQPSTHMDETRRVSTGRPLNDSRADAVNTDSLSQTMHLMGAMMAYPHNTEIFGENEPADYLYKVISGSVRTYKILSDGRRQVGGLYLPGPSATPRCWWSRAVPSVPWLPAIRRSHSSSSR